LVLHDKVVIDNGLIPKAFESHLGSLRVLLEAGLPMVRNKNAGHGKGPSGRQVPDGMASYALHLAAANIVFLVECFN
jgi:hypothetical protein